MPQSDAQDSARWLSTSGVAKRLGVSVRTVQRMEARGDLHPRRLPSGHRRYAMSDVDALLCDKAAS